ncbi:protein of unknown function [Evansella caseinilytica]|uniref:DUF5081 family protein n=1 Tax=Evansella caseinilytica TaxID=1503961 RepID=A0A1H3TJL6_9BACI|nr:DUF5081 family protein [Evansella caseinilytica]SDZ50512.1 protein of unknown function [Evansella caseinilytica]
MTASSTDTFSVPELYLLAAAFGGNSLFGLPEKERYQFFGEEVFEEAHNRLKEKQILSPEGKITKNGAIIIRAVEYYYHSKQFVRINNLMFAFREDNDEELIMLVEVEEQRAYKLFVLSKVLAFQILGKNFPIIFREPGEDEKTFLKKELSKKERQKTAQFEPGEALINLESFHMEETPHEQTNPAFYQQWLVFPKAEKLIMVDTVQQTYYHASQHWFLKLLFDELHFPYKEKEAK